MIKGAMASADEGEEKMPEAFSVGTRRAYAKGYAYPYNKQKIDMETVYVCNKGSDSARDNEFLVLRRESDAWIAYNSSRTGNLLTCRNGTFRSKDDITKAGYHLWEMNKSATKGQEIDDPFGGAVFGVLPR